MSRQGGATKLSVLKTIRKVVIIPMENRQCNGTWLLAASKHYFIHFPLVHPHTVCSNNRFHKVQESAHCIIRINNYQPKILFRLSKEKSVRMQVTSFLACLIHLDSLINYV